MVFAFGVQKSLLPFTFSVEPQKGLVAEASGIPFIRGSYLQFYKPDWSKGYYSTSNDPQTVKEVVPGTFELSFISADHLAQGTVTYHRRANSLYIHYDLSWNGDEPVNVEIANGLIWAPAVERGLLTADGNATRPLDKYSYSGEGIGTRRFAPDATKYTFAASAGVFGSESSIPLTMFDARGYNQDWATGHQYFWLGNLALPISKGKPISFDVRFQFQFQNGASPSEQVIPNLKLQTVPNAGSLLPDNSKPPLIPKPESAKLDWNHPAVYAGSFMFPIGEFDHVDQFKASLANRFQVPAPSPKSKLIAIDGGVSKLGLAPGGYRLTIAENKISVLGEEDEGLRNGLNRLASIAFLQDGKICFPTGTIVDQPKSGWRGVHLFVGPHAPAFHTKLWNKVLRPLNFNRVVLQCERTQWDSLPGIATPMTMAKPDLVKLFAFYRSIGVDPIPLLESYGHMEWLFANKRNLDLAFDQAEPYAVDPMNPKTEETLDKLWNEVIETLHPDTIHFGLDEVDMRGRPIDPTTKTKLWGKQLGTLEAIARKNNVGMMVWGDEGLANGEAPDATNGDTKKDAAARRAAIPRGALVGDWHYSGEFKPTDYRQTLQTWKDSGLNPIATTWYIPSNIAAFDTEAGLLGCGTLQSTWCGYESTEEGMLDAFNQFTAMVLAADYSWSGRKEAPSALDYDPSEVFRKMYFGTPSPLTPTYGFSQTLSNPLEEPLTIGQIHYAHPFTLSFSSRLLNSQSAPSGVIFQTGAKATRIEFACTTAYPAVEDGEPVAQIQVTLADGTQRIRKLIYGRDIRAAGDSAVLPLADRDRKTGVCTVELVVGQLPIGVQNVAIKMLNPYTGFSIRGIEFVK